MATLRHALFADYITPGLNSKVTIVGVFDTLFLPQELLGKMIAGFFVFAHIECSIVDGSHHDLELVFVDGNHTPIGEPMRYREFVMNQAAPGLPMSGKLIAPVVPGVAFPEYGDYTAAIRFDGRFLEGAATLTVAAPQGQRAK